MAQTLVSIVIPAFNAGEYLRESIDSILQQTYRNIELIVLNDGSTDHTEDILRSYPAGSFHWESHANMGQSATLNKGWSMARGEVLGYLSADDLLLPDSVHVLLNALSAAEETIAVYGDYLLIDAQGKKVGCVKAKPFNHARMISHLHCPIGPGALFLRSAFLKTGGWNTALRLVPDFDFWLRMGCHGQIRHVPVTVASWRVHAFSQTNACADVRQADEVIQVMSHLYDDVSAVHALPVTRAHAFAQARVFSAAKHLAAGRYVRSVQRLHEAWQHSVGSVCSLHSLRLICGALKVRFLHLLRRK